MKRFKLVLSHIAPFLGAVLIIALTINVSGWFYLLYVAGGIGLWMYLWGRPDFMHGEVGEMIFFAAIIWCLFAAIPALLGWLPPHNNLSLKEQMQL